MKQFIAFVIKEAKHILRDKRTMTDVKNVRTVVVTSEMSPRTQQAVERLAQSEYFIITQTVNTPQEAERLIRSQKADMALVFAQGRGMQMMVDGSDPNMAQQWTTYARQTIANSSLSTIHSQLLYNPQMKSAYNFVPAIMGMLLMLICAMMTSISIVREKEKGTMEVLLVSPVRPLILMVIIAKAVPYLVLAFGILITILLMARFVLGVPLAGSLFWILAVSTLYILLALSLGLLISNVAQTQLVALLLSAMVLLMPVVMLSGMLFPVESMPQVLQWLAAVVPPRYYIEAMRKLMIMGVGIGEVAREVAVLTGMTVVLLAMEFLQIRRNAFLPKLIIMFPIVIMCVMPWVMQMEVKNIVVDVVDIDHTVESQRLVQQIAASNYFIFGGQKATYAEAIKDIEKGKADVILEIRNGKYLIAANAVNGTKGSMGSAYLSQIVTSRQQIVNSQLSILNLYNKGQNYKLFMIPALFAIVMMLMTGFLPTLNIVGEKEAGTIEQINVTPVSKWSFILAKLIPYWLIALFVITVCLLLAWLVYGITPAGPVWLIYVLAMLLALFFSSFGLIVSNYSDTMQQAMFVMWFFVVSIMLLSGLFTPTRSMPQWAYLTTYINPMHYFIDAIRTVFIRGGGLHETAHQVLALAGIGTLMGCWAVQSYKKNS